MSKALRLAHKSVVLKERLAHKSVVLEENLTDVEHPGQTYPAGAVCEGKVLICETRQLVCITSTMNKKYIYITYKIQY